MWGRTKPERLTVDAIQTRLAREAARALIARDDEQNGRTAVIVHTAPARSFTLGQARRMMQLHRSCDRTLCARKQAAVDVLVASGVMRLDSRVGY
ncbi:hypothetical protein AB0L62_13585 [Nocardia asteroides]|uniref:hypothetical protein n=1 Tax=Nocardia asteroides TaxID=1824 RepID=UPI00343344FF